MDIDDRQLVDQLVEQNARMNRQNTILMRSIMGIVLLLVVAVGVRLFWKQSTVLASPATPDKSTAIDTLQAKKLEVVDESGNVLFAIRQGESGGGQLELYSAELKRVWSLGIEGDESLPRMISYRDGQSPRWTLGEELVFWDLRDEETWSIGSYFLGLKEEGRNAIIFGADDGGRGRITLCDTEGLPNLLLGGREQGAYIRAYNSQRRDTSTGEMRDSKKKIFELSTNGDGNAELKLNDSEGNAMISHTTDSGGLIVTNDPDENKVVSIGTFQEEAFSTAGIQIDYPSQNLAYAMLVGEQDGQSTAATVLNYDKEEPQPAVSTVVGSGSAANICLTEYRDLNGTREIAFQADRDRKNPTSSIRGNQVMIEGKIVKGELK